MKKTIQILALTLLLASCANPLVKPAKAYQETVGKDYIRLLEKSDLNDDSKKRRIKLVHEFSELIEKAGK